LAGLSSLDVEDVLRDGLVEGKVQAWLGSRAQREVIGLVALAKQLEVDAANLAKVIEGRRPLSKARIAVIARQVDARNYLYWIYI